eukprot:356004-Chlamydomonas_euryale.AAC.5
MATLHSPGGATLPPTPPTLSAAAASTTTTLASQPAPLALVRYCRSVSQPDIRGCANRRANGTCRVRALESEARSDKDRAIVSP